MNKLHYENPATLKTDMDQLIDFRGEEDSVHSPTKAKEQDNSQLKMPSKYATILTCSFEKDQEIGINLKMLP